MVTSGITATGPCTPSSPGTRWRRPARSRTSSTSTRSRSRGRRSHREPGFNVNLSQHECQAPEVRREGDIALVYNNSIFSSMNIVSPNLSFTYDWSLLSITSLNKFSSCFYIASIWLLLLKPMITFSAVIIFHHNNNIDADILRIWRVINQLRFTIHSKHFTSCFMLQ